MTGKVQEVKNGKRLAEATVKQLTGGDRIKARRMRQDFSEFDPTHKFVISANFKPEIRGTDEAIWRRIKLVPFEVMFVEDEADVDHDRGRFLVDKNLEETLFAEARGILALMVRACLSWQSSGLAEPPTVTTASNKHRDDMGDLGCFDFIHNVRARGKSVLGALLALLIATPRNPS